MRKFLLPAIVACCLSGLDGGCVQASDVVLSDSDAIRVTFNRGRNVKKVVGGSIGEKHATFQPEVKIINGSFRDFQGNTGVVMLLGEDTTKQDNWRVMLRKEFSFDLPASKTHDWVGEPFEQGFDRTLAKSGYDYDGYVVLIKNSQGEIVQKFSSKPRWIANVVKAWNMEQGKDYSKIYFQ